MVESNLTGKDYLNFRSVISIIQNLGDENPSLTPINLHILRNLWLPDVEILDLKAFETHSVLSKLEGKDQIKRLEIL